MQFNIKFQDIGGHDQNTVILHLLVVIGYDYCEILMICEIYGSDDKITLHPPCYKINQPNERHWVREAQGGHPEAVEQCPGGG